MQVWFNTIRYPEHVALHNLPADELRVIHDTLAAEVLPEPEAGPSGDRARHNLGVYRRFVDHQLARAGSTKPPPSRAATTRPAWPRCRWSCALVKQRRWAATECYRLAPRRPAIRASSPGWR